MMKASTRPGRRVLGLVVAASLAGGCAGPTGPVVGDWRGYESTHIVSFFAQVEIILDGPPGSTSGTYHYVRTSREDFGSGVGRSFRWTEHWSARPIEVDGRRLGLVHLDRLPNGFLLDYVLLEDGRLVPVADPSRPDLSPRAMRFALSPLPRTAYGYGRP